MSSKKRIALLKFDFPKIRSVPYYYIWDIVPFWVLQEGRMHKDVYNTYLSAKEN